MKKFDIFIQVHGLREGPFPPEDIHLGTFEADSMPAALDAAFPDHHVVLSLTEVGTDNTLEATGTLALKLKG